MAKAFVDEVLQRAGLMRRSSSTWITGFAFGALAGAFAGSVASLLATPMNGREMRDQLGTRAKELADQTQSAIAEITSAVKSKLEAAPAALAEAKSDLKDKLLTPAPRAEHSHANNHGVKA